MFFSKHIPVHEDDVILQFLFLGGRYFLGNNNFSVTSA